MPKGARVDPGRPRSLPFVRILGTLGLLGILASPLLVRAQQDGVPQPGQAVSAEATETGARLTRAALTAADLGADYQLRPGSGLTVVDGMFTHYVVLQRELRGIFSPGPLAVMGSLSTTEDGLPPDAFDQLVQNLTTEFQLTGQARAVTGPAIGEQTVWLKGEQAIAGTPADFHTVAFVASETAVFVSVGGFPERVTQADAAGLASLVAARLGSPPAAPGTSTAIVEPRAVVSAPVAAEARATAHQNLGNRYLETGSYRAALDEFDQVVLLFPDLPAPHYSRGNALRALGHNDEALAAFDRALVLDPNWADAHDNRGVVLESLGRYAEALGAFDAAAQLAPEDADMPFGQAHALAALQRYPEALVAIDRAIELHPAWAEAFYNRGSILDGLGQEAEAVASYRRAIALQDNYPEAHHNLGLLLFNAGRYEEALAEHTRARDLRSNAPAFHQGRGAALLRLERYEEALDAFDHLVALSPRFAFGHYDRGMALVYLHRDEESAEAFRRAVDLDPTFEARVRAFLRVTAPDYDEDPVPTR